jgi:hypothetical protein
MNTRTTNYDFNSTAWKKSRYKLHLIVSIKTKGNNLGCVEGLRYEITESNRHPMAIWFWETLVNGLLMEKSISWNYGATFWPLLLGNKYKKGVSWIVMKKNTSRYFVNKPCFGRNSIFG